MAKSGFVLEMEIYSGLELVGNPADIAVNVAPPSVDFDIAFAPTLSE